MSDNHTLFAPLSALLPKTIPTHWADLGCGSGVFTAVLADFLKAGSHISAIDRAPQRLDKMMGDKVSVSFKCADFVSEELNLQSLDGILMANALHFVKDKEALIGKLEQFFEKSPRFLIVEYDHSRPSQWEPYPAPFPMLSKLFEGLGYKNLKKLGERQSVYGGKMYAVLVTG